MSAADGIVDFSAERARRTEPAPPAVDPLLRAAEMIEVYAGDVTRHSIAAFGAVDPVAHTACVLAGYVRQLAHDMEPVASPGRPD